MNGVILASLTDSEDYAKAVAAKVGRPIKCAACVYDTGKRQVSVYTAQKTMHHFFLATRIQPVDNSRAVSRTII